MTITVTVDELKEFQSQYHEWIVKRTRFIEELCFKNADRAMGFGMREGSRDFIYKEAVEWESKNPKPKLIPSV